MAKTYDTYKESGIAWIGNIPSGWDVKKLKYSCKLYGRIGFRGYTADDLVDEGEGAITLSPTNFNGMKLNYSHCSYLNWNKYEESPEIKVYNGDVVLVKTASVGKCAYVSNLPLECTVNPQILVLKEHKDYSKYIAYLFNTKLGEAYIDTTKGGSTIYTISQEKIGNYIFPFPPLTEQQAITTYLDEKCGEIDSLISLQEEMISELQAYKQSIISEAVTKGLDSNVPMKDSGVEWIGMIPEGWKIQRLRTLGNCQNGISKGGEYFGDEFDFPFVNYTDAYKNIDVPYPEGRANSTEEDRKQYSLIEGDILFTRTSETIDEIGYASTCTQTIPNAVFSGFLIRFRPTGKELYYGFSKYYFRSSIHRAFFVKEMNLVTRASLSQNLLKNLPTLIPPLSEQQAIASYLDEKTSQIDSLIALKQEKITELKDYKKSIIYEYVTGKKKV